MGEKTLMAINNFKAFGIGAGANVSSQADYEELTALITGFQSGKASSAQINKALRQSSTMANVLAQFISDSASVDVLDNGMPATILANLKATMTALTLGRLLNVKLITTSQVYTPTTGTKKIIIEAVAGGGGGGGAPVTTSTQSSCGSGGGSGDYVKTPLLSAQSLSITIGSGGAGSNGLTSATAGGDTTVGSIVLLRGGSAGTTGTASTANTILGLYANGSPSTASYPVASIYLSGGQATRGMVIAPSALTGTLGGSGGGSPLGGGAVGQNAATAANSATEFGGGGAGAANFGASGSKAGGAGFSGVVIIWEYA